MKSYRVKPMAKDPRLLEMKKRVKKMQARSKWAGFFYLIGTLALAGLAALPLLETDAAKLGVAEFWTTFLEEATLMQMIVAGLYGAMFIGLVINVIKAFSKLNWLFTRSASRTYGVNRNMYAMDELGHVFSGSLAAVLNFHFLIYLILGTANVAMMMLAAVGVGVVIHLLAGVIGGFVSLFEVGDFGIREVAREVGMLAPFVRNVLQIAVCCTLIQMFVGVATISSVIAADDIVGAIMGDVVGFAIQAALIICIMVLVKHAMNTTEYSIDGRLAPGMKNFKIFSFLTAVVAAAAMALIHLDYLYIAIVAGAMFLIEMIMRKAPRFPEEKIKPEPEEEVAPNGMQNPYGPNPYGPNPYGPNGPVYQSPYNIGDIITLDEYFNQYYIKEGVILNPYHHPQYPQYPNYFVNSMPGDWMYMQQQ